MIQYAYGFAYICFSLALLMNLWKIIFAKETSDRILALGHNVHQRHCADRALWGGTGNRDLL